MTNLPGSSNNTHLFSTAVDDCSDIPVELAKNYYDSETDLLKCSISFLGSGKVGKTSIIKQFVYQNFEEKYVPSVTCGKYRKAVFLNGRIYDLVLRDCPGVAHFPDSSLSEWSQFQGFYGLHLSQVGTSAA